MHNNFRPAHAFLIAALCASPLALAAGNQPAGAPAASGPAASAPPQIEPQKAKAAADLAREMQKRGNPLNLDAIQQQELANLRQARFTHEQEIRKLESQLMELANADSYDKGKIEALAKQIASKTEAHLLAHTQKMHAFFKKLTPEQQKQFRTMEERRRKMQEQRMGPMGPGGPAGKPPQRPAGAQPGQAPTKPPQAPAQPSAKPAN